MLKNKITCVPLVTPSSSILQLTAFADDVRVVPGAGGAGIDPKFIFETRYIPENIVITTVDNGPENIGAEVLRQDAKRVNLTPLSTAVFGQGLSIDESAFGRSSESYFLNSVLISVDTNFGPAKFRFGVSNFTQTQDNNPFEGLSTDVVLYYEV